MTELQGMALRAICWDVFRLLAELSQALLILWLLDRVEKLEKIEEVKCLKEKIKD